MNEKDEKDEFKIYFLNLEKEDNRECSMMDFYSINNYAVSIQDRGRPMVFIDATKQYYKIHKLSSIVVNLFGTRTFINTDAMANVKQSATDPSILIIDYEPSRNKYLYLKVSDVREDVKELITDIENMYYVWFEMSLTCCCDNKKEKAMPIKMNQTELRFFVETAPGCWNAINKEFKGTPVKINLEIEKVIYNDPATVILWTDGSKTVVKCQEGDAYDPQKGFLLCVFKKYFGDNKGNYNNIIKKYCQ